MGKGKMDDAAAERIKKARGDKDDFARRAALAARANKDGGQAQGGGQSGTSDTKQGGGEASKK